jgi:hypothetical protein
MGFFPAVFAVWDAFLFDLHQIYIFGVSFLRFSQSTGKTAAKTAPKDKKAEGFLPRPFV